MIKATATCAENGDSDLYTGPMPLPVSVCASQTLLTQYLKKY